MPRLFGEDVQISMVIPYKKYEKFMKLYDTEVPLILKPVLKKAIKKSDYYAEIFLLGLKTKYNEVFGGN